MRYIHIKFLPQLFRMHLSSFLPPNQPSMTRVNYDEMSKKVVHTKSIDIYISISMGYDEICLRLHTLAISRDISDITCRNSGNLIKL